MKEKKLTLPFKAVGGKSWLLPKIEPLWNFYRDKRWFDPFVGGGGLPLLLKPDVALLSDANPYQIFGFQWVKNFSEFEIPYTHSKENYYKLRSEFNRAIQDSEISRLSLGEYFFRLNRSCYKGLWRVNRKGELNTPWGHYKKFPEIDLNYWSNVIRNSDWKFTSGNAIEIIQKYLLPDDFLFLDPPYYNTFDSYTKEGFSWEDQVNLAEISSKHKGPTIICNSSDKNISDLYRDYGFHVDTIPAQQKLKPQCQKFEVFATKNILVDNSNHWR